MRQGTIAVGVLLGTLVTWAVLVDAFWFVCDDAFISFRYALQAAAGHGLRFNLGEHVPVEGYSNLLWVLIATGVQGVGLRPDAVMPLLSALTGAILIVRVFGVARDRLGLDPTVASLTAAAAALHPSMPIWATSGLATMPAAWLMFELFDQWVLDDDEGAVRASWWVVIALVLVRTEGIGWVGVIGVLGALRRLLPGDRPADGLGTLGRLVGLGLVVLGAHLLFRLATYEAWVSNTAAAKVDFGLDRVLRGWTYVGGFWVATLVPPIHLALTPLLWRQARGKGALVAVMATGAPLYAIVVGGDFMTMGRLMVPGVAFAALGLGALVQALADRGPALRAVGAGVALGLTLLGMLPLWDVHVVSEEDRKAWRVRYNTLDFRSEVEQWRFMRRNAEAWSELGRALHEVAEPGDGVVLGAIGAVGYHAPEVFVYDRFGLVTREVAMRDVRSKGRPHSPGHDKHVPVTFFVEDAPRFLRIERLQRPGLVLRSARMWRARGDAEGPYGPVLYALSDGDLFLGLERVDDPDAAWEALPSAVQEARRSTPRRRSPVSDLKR